MDGTTMTRKLRRGSGGLPLLLAAPLICLTGCGGDGGGNLSGGGKPDGYVYVASAAAPNVQMPGTVFQYSIGSDGSLSPLATASVPAGVHPVAMISDPTGHYVYIVNQGDSTISQYSVSAGGGLAALSPATVKVGGTSASVAGYSLSVDPSGHSLYLVMTPLNPAMPASISIFQYAIGNDGTLSPLNPAAVDVAAVGVGSLAIDPTGKYAYLAGGAVVGEAESVNDEVLQFSIAAGGQLTPLLSQTVAATHNAFGVAIFPSGRTAYVLSACIDDACKGQIAEYSVGENGALTPTGATTATASHVIPISLNTDTSESSAYLLTNLMGVDTNAGMVYQYTFNSTGALVPATPPSVNVSSGAVAQSVVGQRLYALSSNALGFASGAPTGGHIDHYSIGAGGLLALVGTTTLTVDYPKAMAVVAAH